MQVYKSMEPLVVEFFVVSLLCVCAFCEQDLSSLENVGHEDGYATNRFSFEACHF